jgi:hypothetical protein
MLLTLLKCRYFDGLLISQFTRNTSSGIVRMKEELLHEEYGA